MLSIEKYGVGNIFLIQETTILGGGRMIAWKEGENIYNRLKVIIIKENGFAIKKKGLVNLSIVMEIIILDCGKMTSSKGEGMKNRLMEIII